MIWVFECKRGRFHGETTQPLQWVGLTCVFLQSRTKREVIFINDGRDERFLVIEVRLNDRW